MRGLGSFAVGVLAANDFADWGFASERVFYLPYSIAPVSICTSTEIPVGPRPQTRFLFLGALCPRKGIDILLNAFAIVRRTDSRALLTLVGRDDSGGGYEELAGKLGVSPGVKFCPSVDADKIGLALAQCDVLVLPSRFDGWGVALSEGASVGKALISTETCGAAHHLIEDGVSGFRVPAGDIAALAERMLRYCRDPVLSAAHGKKAESLNVDLLPDRNALRMIRSLEALIAH